MYAQNGVLSFCQKNYNINIIMTANYKLCFIFFFIKKAISNNYFNRQTISFWMYLFVEPISGS